MPDFDMKVKDTMEESRLLRFVYKKFQKENENFW